MREEWERGEMEGGDPNLKRCNDIRYKNRQVGPYGGPFITGPFHYVMTELCNVIY